MFNCFLDLNDDIERTNVTKDLWSWINFKQTAEWNSCEMSEFEFLNSDWSADLLWLWRDSEKSEEDRFFYMIFLFFLLDFSTNISNRSFIVKYDLTDDSWSWCLKIDVCNELDEDVEDIHVDLWWRDLNAADTADVIAEADVTKNVEKQMSCAFIIEINKDDDFIDADIDLNVIDELLETDANLRKRDDFASVFELVAIASFEIFGVMKDVIDKSIWLLFSSTKRCFSALKQRFVEEKSSHIDLSITSFITPKISKEAIATSSKTEAKSSRFLRFASVSSNSSITFKSMSASIKSSSLFISMMKAHDICFSTFFVTSASAITSAVSAAFKSRHHKSTCMSSTSSSSSLQTSIFKHQDQESSVKSYFTMNDLFEMFVEKSSKKNRNII